MWLYLHLFFMQCQSLFVVRIAEQPGQRCIHKLKSIHVKILIDDHIRFSQFKNKHLKIHENLNFNFKKSSLLHKPFIIIYNKNIVKWSARSEGEGVQKTVHMVYGYIHSDLSSYWPSTFQLKGGLLQNQNIHINRNRRISYGQYES